MAKVPSTVLLTEMIGSDKKAPFGPGKGKGQFNLPTCVAVDDKGLIYVCDYLNDRVQVFKSDGSFVRSFPVRRPAQITLDTKRDELYVSSFLFHNDRDRKLASKSHVPAQLIRFKGISSPKKTAVIPVPTIDYWDWSGRYRGHPLQLSVIVDTHASEPIVWVSEGYQRDSRIDRGSVKDSHIRLYTIKGNKLVLKRDFCEDVKKSVARTSRPRYARQRMAVNPKNGRLYISEGESATFKAFKALLEADSETGNVKLVDLPFDAEDFCFDNNGFAYLRTLNALVRYDPVKWREIPWDYGEERPHVQFSSIGGGKNTKAISKAFSASAGLF